MSLELIVIAPASGLPPETRTEVDVVAGHGIVGDRYFHRTPKEPGQQITLIEAEAIEAYNRAHGTDIPWTLPRRNLVVRGIRLNELVGRQFNLGEVRLQGVELCEPCEFFGQRLENPLLSLTQTVAVWIGRGGLRADVLRGGTLRQGDQLILD